MQFQIVSNAVRMHTLETLLSTFSLQFQIVSNIVKMHALETLPLLCVIFKFCSSFFTGPPSPNGPTTFRLPSYASGIHLIHKCASPIHIQSCLFLTHTHIHNDSWILSQIIFLISLLFGISLKTIATVSPYVQAMRILKKGVCMLSVYNVLNKEKSRVTRPEKNC